MTQEEALDIIRFVFLHTDNHLNEDRPISAEDIHEALVMACAALCKNSLPSDLDEVANRQAALEQPYKWEEEQDGSFGVTPLFVMSNVRSAFKAGAEWLAGQGVSMLGKVGIYGVDVESITKELREAGFNLGEEIILQIRKK